jgi:hypothetical protein
MVSQDQRTDHPREDTDQWGGQVERTSEQDIELSVQDAS